jgi:dCTP diphosphatase
MMTDEQTTVAALRAATEDFVARRDWQQFHTPKNLSISIAIEAAELMEHFQWLSLEASQAAVEDPAERAEVADELADVIIYCMSMSNACGVDISDAVLAKLARNEGRFPVGEFQGRSRKPEREKD